MYDLNQIAALTGLSKNYVRDKLTKRPDFPSPDIRLSQKIKWWKPETIKKWLKEQEKNQKKIAFARKLHTDNASA